MKIALTFAALVGLTASAFANAEVGKPAPDFTLKDVSGKEYKLSDLKGKTVVLEWVNFGCPFVGKQYGTGNMQKTQKEATEKGVVWLSICSSAPGNQGYLKREELPEAVKETQTNATAYLPDESGDVGRLYDAKTTPEIFIINPKGTLVYEGAIDDKPTPDWNSVPGAKNFVSAALNESLSGKPVTMPSTKSYGCSVKYGK